ncbi:hypothetical protein IAT40_000541 [Kwoniella sp. CBS 6097]
MLSHANGSYFERIAELKAPSSVRQDGSGIGVHTNGSGIGESSNECYVEVITEPFRICLEDHLAPYGEFDWRVTCLIDGKIISAFVWNGNYSSTALEYVDSTDGRSRYELKFTQLETTNDPAKVDMSGDELKQVGIVELQLQKGRIQQIYNSYAGLAKHNDAKQGVSAGAANDSPAELRKGVAHETGELDMIAHRFYFKYHSHFALIQEGIIPDDTATATSAAQNRSLTENDQGNDHDDEKEEKPPIDGDQQKMLEYYERQNARLQRKLNRAEKRSRSLAASMSTQKEKEVIDLSTISDNED